MSAPTLEEITQGNVQVVDLAHALNEENPYWPGERYAPFEFEVIASLEKDGVYSGAFSTPEHLGTHLDAPNHFAAEQVSVDQIPFQRLVAPMVVVDIRDRCADDPDYRLSREDLREWEQQHGSIPSDAVLFAWTGWDAYWSNYARYKNEDAAGRLHFPGFSSEAAQFLIDQRGVKGIGIDTLSVDYGLSTDFSVHHMVNRVGGYQIENAANLGAVPAKGAWMIAAPIKIEGGSGGPVRIWAVFE